MALGKEDALAKMAAAAKNQRWIADASDVLVAVCIQRGKGGLFTTDPIWAMLGSNKPDEHRTMGVVIRMAQAAGLIRYTGRTTTSTIANGHDRIIRIYEVL